MNGQSVPLWAWLEDGDTVRIGRFTFILRSDLRRRGSSAAMFRSMRAPMWTRPDRPAGETPAVVPLAMGPSWRCGRESPAPIC